MSDSEYSESEYMETQEYARTVRPATAAEMEADRLQVNRNLEIIRLRAQLKEMQLKYNSRYKSNRPPNNRQQNKQD